MKLLLGNVFVLPKYTQCPRSDILTTSNSHHCILTGPSSCSSTPRADPDMFRTNPISEFGSQEWPASPAAAAAASPGPSRRFDAVTGEASFSPPFETSSLVASPVPQEQQPAQPQTAVAVATEDMQSFLAKLDALDKKMEALMKAVLDTQAMVIQNRQMIGAMASSKLPASISGTSRTWFEIYQEIHASVRHGDAATSTPTYDALSPSYSSQSRPSPQSSPLHQVESSPSKRKRNPTVSSPRDEERM